MALDLHAAECTSTDDGECLAVAKRQLQLMESQLQRFLRMGKRPSEIVRREVDWRVLIENLLPLVRPAAQHAGVALESRLPSERLATSGDEDALGQVLLNLLLNAIEAAQQQRLEQHDRRCFVRVEVIESDVDQVVIEISDSGGGPSDAVAAKLFEPFVTSKAEGAGLGLAVASDIVAAHGGTIAWQRNDETTQFRVTFPLAKAQPAVATCVATPN